MKFSTKLKTAFVSAGLVFSSTVFAQEDIGQIVAAGQQDATKLAQAYLTPLFKGIGVGINSGWNNTGSVKKIGRFELRISASGAWVPGSDRSFDVNSLGLSNNVRLKSGSPSSSPTFAGEDGSRRATLEVFDNQNRKLDEFELPAGTDVSFIPAPQIQGSIGLPRGIELSLRGFPEVSFGDLGKLGMIGGGIKIEPLRLISKTANKLLPVDIALAVGYTRLNYELPLDYEAPDNSNVPDNQKVTAKLTGINAEAIISKKLLFFTPFLSLGYNSAKADAGLKGDYRVASGYNITGPVLGPTYSTITDPVSIDETFVSNFRSNIGFQANLTFFRIYASYSMSEYNSVNAGIGFGIGK